jgi:signal transduction histidine kinase
MFHVLGCVVYQHDLRLVALAGVLCIFACVTAMSMLSRARFAAGRIRAAWLAAAGTVAGCGIWGTHFVAMLAYESGFPVAYDPGLTVLSILIAITLCGGGFMLALQPGRATVGGAVTGAAIGAMHYVGMAAVRVPADAIWDARYVASSVVIGVAIMAFGMRFAFRRDDWRWYLASGLIFTVAICSMHFTAMSAVVYKFDPRVVVPDAVMAPDALAIAVAASAVLVIALGLVGALVDHHLALRASNEAVRLREHIAELEATKEALEETSQNLAVALTAADEANQAKSRFLAAMSHELRTPLNAVIGFSEVLKMESFGALGSPRYKEYVADIHASGTHLLAVINDILDISRLDSGDMSLEETALDLKKVIHESLRMMSHQAAAAGVALDEEIDDGLPLVRADARRIKQVLINLLSNAVKFTQAKGSVLVRAFTAAEGVAISVTDTGIGIGKADLARALERFGQVDSTLSRKYEGVGLGLPLARQLIEMHGGSLELKSMPSVGTTVVVTLPVSRIVARQSVAAA